MRSGVFESISCDRPFEIWTGDNNSDHKVMNNIEAVGVLL
jgi:hypothetical protein